MMVTGPDLLIPAHQAQLQRLLEIRKQLRREQQQAMSPAVERALHLADLYLVLALSNYGYIDVVLPEED